MTCNQNICGFDGRASTDENPDALVYTWNFGNGSGSGSFVSRTYTAPNTYVVSLTVRDEYNSSVTSATQNVIITEPPTNVAPTAIMGVPSCVGLVCNFTSSQSSDSNPGDTITRLWNFGDVPATTSTSTSPTKTFLAGGTYTVTVTVTDGWGKATTATRQVTVAPLP